MQNSPALDAHGLVKTYPGGRGRPPVTALAGLSLTARTGSVLALLGPNGAGKSTTVKILSTLSRADAGTATVAGHDVAHRPDQVRRAIGLVAQRSVVDPMDTGTENLVLAGRLHGLSAGEARTRAAELLDVFGLADAAHRRAGTWSGGMVRKLDVAVGLVHRPQVLFLDEPTTGLDPEARAELWAQIERLVRLEQVTVLLTTHYLDEADRLADQVVIVDHGRVVAEGTPDELKSALAGDGLAVELGLGHDAGRAVDAARRVAGLADVTVDGATLRARAARGAALLPPLIAALEEAGVRVEAASVARPGLDDVYLRHTGRSMAAMAERAA
ncbi:ATP-binding cassette domain-containing protein [Actinotalea sp. M2MS4P-6]|uniref:ABC transporter ATP-binding protein n=1 Tax=Actinotalea sp. M2MS4P-6 TaxID=2983762 RepID=UPI0021E51036|nr:ATP-binding cassette domain-containing protein [Actinotalea sp. M2MS4P-6]MCV2393596.1 ATP-binding cassette domain-containing protein [Actinotalea sp. M2MS4P-6]